MPGIIEYVIIKCYTKSFLGFLVTGVSMATTSKSQSETSLDNLVEEHYDYLFNYSYRYFRSREKAEDLVQETFLAATEAISRFEGKSSYRTWLTSILRHKIMDELKKKNKPQQEALDINDDELMSHFFDQNEHWTAETGPLVWGYSPDKTLSQKQFFSVLENCMGKLPEKVRQMFVLREVEGYDRDEISKIMNYTSSNTGVILHRARILLQQCLQLNWFQEKSRSKI